MYECERNSVHVRLVVCMYVGEGGGGRGMGEGVRACVSCTLSQNRKAATANF